MRSIDMPKVKKPSDANPNILFRQVREQHIMTGIETLPQFYSFIKKSPKHTGVMRDLLNDGQWRRFAENISLAGLNTSTVTALCALLEKDRFNTFNYVVTRINIPLLIRNSRAHFIDAVPVLYTKSSQAHERMKKELKELEQKSKAAKSESGDEYSDSYQEYEEIQSCRLKLDSCYKMRYNLQAILTNWQLQYYQVHPPLTVGKDRMELFMAHNKPQSKCCVT
jgi:hypothetical protein